MLRLALCISLLFAIQQTAAHAKKQEKQKKQAATHTKKDEKQEKHKKHKKHKKHRHHKAHVHGSGKLNLVMEGKQIMIEMQIPAHDIVGFEHKPKSKKQKDKVASAKKTLQNAGEIIKLPKAANCKLTGNPKVIAGMEEKKHQDSHHHKEEDEHSEFTIGYQFDCQNIKNLNQVELLIFKKFKGIKKIKAQGVTKKGQFSGNLNHKAAVFHLRK